MRNQVFIKGIVYQEGRFCGYRGGGSTVDGIGRQCIQVVEDLFAEAGNVQRDIPFFFGSAFSSLKSLHEFNRTSEEKGALFVNPSLFPNTVLNAPSCRTSIYHKITSPIYNISNGDASALDALELAYSYLASGSIQNAVVCAAEEHSFFAEQIEQGKVRDGCGALYLSLEPSEYEIRSIVKQDQTDTDKKGAQSTDLFRILKEGLIYGKENKSCITIKYHTQQYQAEIQVEKK